MKNQTLAILGGSKTIKLPFKKYNPIGFEELKAAEEVVRSGVLSKFLGAWGDDFFGGPKVQEFERLCESKFKVKHAISVNSWTSGLIASVGAIGIEPGDEVIVSPWTMCATATAILHWNAIPVFADIEPKTFCIDPISIEKCLTPYTKAIIAVDIFGHPSDMGAIMAIAKKYDLKVIADTAQSPGTFYQGLLTGTIGDVGGYSLNYHKHIHTGEGGIVVTNDDLIANKVRLIRNHGEAVVGPKGENDLVNVIGYNFRLGELEAAIGIEQIKKLDLLVQKRQNIAKKITDGLQGLEGLWLPEVKEGCTHAYYIYPMVLDINKIGVTRKRIVEALRSEGVDGLIEGYVNIHRLPMYQRKIAYGSMGFPWNSDICKREVDYAVGICPVAEELHDVSFLGYSMCLHDLSDDEISLLVESFQKVWRNINLLKN